jgi:SAM-dependent methyltransferase
LDSKAFFEKFFKSKKDYSYSKSLLDFFEKDVRPKLAENAETNINILDIGSGDYSIFEDVKDFRASVTAVDFSKHAILRSPKSKIKYLEGDITDTKFFPDLSFELIFDSHCFNCITTQDERDKAFKNIFAGLKTGGLFASEMMVQPVGTKAAIPFKIIKTALELEEEILSHGFGINYFMISKDCGFMSEIDGVEIKCDLLKIIARK